MVGVKYVGPVWDNSGYASATREYIYALHKKGIPLTVKPFCFEQNQSSVGDDEKRRLISSLVDKDIEYDTVICQLTPDMAIRNREEDKRNISYFAWESSVVHPDWSVCLDFMDMVFVPCDWNVKCLKECGVRPPVYKVPHGVDINKFDIIGGAQLDLPGISEDTFVFYNIFQWNPRKNPETLIRAYFNAFRNNEDVALVLKTYLTNGSEKETNFIAEQIRRIKKDMDLVSYPKLVLIPNLMTESQLLKLHNRCDCLVSLHYSEGWGLVPFDAGLCGNPVIATGATGNMEYMNEENSYPVDYRWGYVRGMSMFNKWYRGDGLWAEPDDLHATQLLRHVYENPQEARERALKLQRSIKENFSWEEVTDVIIDKLNRG